MEEEVGVKLFDRGSRRITLANEGILLRRRAKEILQLVDETEKELNLSTNAAVMVNPGLAYSVIIEGAVPFWNQSQITYRPLSPDLTATSVLAWRRGQPFSLAATKFIEHIKCFLGMDKV